jgi:uncharacterized protein YbaR (Trm112 family)
VLPSDLLDVLVCPRSKQPLVYFPRGEDNVDETHGFLLCPASRLRYPIRDGVPVMLVDEATEVSAQAVEALIARACQLGLRVSSSTAAASAAGPT